MSNAKELIEAQQALDDVRAQKQSVDEYQTDQLVRVKSLLRRTKGFLKEKQSLRPVKGPIAFLVREWGDIEVYENIQGNTFIVPPPTEHQKMMGTDPLSKEPGKRIIYFSNKDQFNLNFGGESIRCYLFNENDSMPIMADTKVWSERLEYTIDAVLINYEKLKNQLANRKNQWVVELVKWGGLAVVGFFIAKWLLFTPEPTTVVAAANTLGEAAKQQVGATTTAVVG